jgi:predicted nicotinamide N-methyase
VSGAAAAFVVASTAVAAPPLVPEIRLHLATEVTPLWQATADALNDSGVEPPFWAFAWPGGQAVARHILDHPAIVAGRRVLDIASGSGMIAIAAARAGAASVTANDIDPYAVAAIALNAVLNGVNLAVSRDDLLDAAPAARWDVILAGDVFYDRAMAARIAPWLSARAREGAAVLIGDPSRAYLPERGLACVATYDVPTSLELEDREVRVTRVWALKG